MQTGPVLADKRNQFALKTMILIFLGFIVMLIDFKIGGGISTAGFLYGILKVPA